MAGLRVVAANRQTWACAGFGLAMTAPMLAFGGLWAVPFVMTAHGVERAAAGSLASLLFLGWGVGAPVIGLLSDRIGRRKAPMLAFGIAATATMAIIVGVDGRRTGRWSGCVSTVSRSPPPARCSSSTASPRAR